MERFAKVCPRCGTRYDAAAAFCQRDGASLRFAEEDTDPRIGQVLLDQFRIEERIGQGGMGAVYRARQTTLGRDVAIKILHPDLARNPDAVRRFHREARISTALDHPNVVRVSLFGQLPDGSLYLVMELLRGRTLAELVRVEMPLPVHRALHIATQVCDGVGEAHGQAIVHRDIKPENIFLITKGRDSDFAKVLDFGIARVLQGDDQTVATQSGLVFGTARYISPEGAAGERTDARSDVYSLGVLTYQLLCGETPFDGSAPVTLLMKHIHDAPPHLKSRPGGAHVPDAIADVVMRALAKNPDARYEDATDLAEVLRMSAQRAGLDVVRLRGGSSSIGSLPSGERRDPSGPMIRERDAAGRGASTVPRTMMLAARGGPEPTLEGAPDPFGGGATSDLPVAGLYRGARRRSALTTVALAFIVGAVLVAGGGWAVRALTAPDAITVEADELVLRGDAALAAHRYDAPEGDNVRALTDRLLEIRPDDADAQRMRRAAVRALEDEAQQAQREGQLADALDRWRRALAFGGENARASAAIAEIERALAVPPREPGLALAPSAPIAGSPALLTATVADDVELEAADRPRFVVLRGTQRVGRRADATPGSDPGTWIATYTFPSSGHYRIKFLTRDDGEERYELTTEIDVARAPRTPTSDRPDPPPTTTQGAVGPFVPQIVDAPALPPRTPQLASTQSPTLPPAYVASPPPPIHPLAPSVPAQVREDPPPPPPPPPPPTPWSSGG